MYLYKAEQRARTENKQMISHRHLFLSPNTRALFSRRTNHKSVFHPCPNLPPIQERIWSVIMYGSRSTLPSRPHCPPIWIQTHSQTCTWVRANSAQPSPYLSPIAVNNDVQMSTIWNLYYQSMILLSHECIRTNEIAVLSMLQKYCNCVIQYAGNFPLQNLVHPVQLRTVAITREIHHSNILHKWIISSQCCDVFFKYLPYQPEVKRLMSAKIRIILKIWW